jgi:hypothetical protein
MPDSMKYIDDDKDDDEDEDEMISGGVTLTSLGIEEGASLYL